RAASSFLCSCCHLVPHVTSCPSPWQIVPPVPIGVVPSSGIKRNILQSPGRSDVRSLGPSRPSPGGSLIQFFGPPAVSSNPLASPDPRIRLRPGFETETDDL